jgi:hypothetical protein
MFLLSLKQLSIEKYYVTMGNCQWSIIYVNLVLTPSITAFVPLCYTQTLV